MFKMENIGEYMYNIRWGGTRPSKIINPQSIKEKLAYLTMQILKIST